MIDIINQYNIKTLFDNKKIEDFADIYIENDIITARYAMDARHIAISIINNLDKIISLNFKHIVRNRTKLFTDYICRLYGYKPIVINSPMEVIDYE
jgi:hypothetical protein